MQYRHVLGEIDAEKNSGQGLASVGSGLRFSNPIVDATRRQRMKEISGGWQAGFDPFIRSAIHHIRKAELK